MRAAVFRAAALSVSVVVYAALMAHAYVPAYPYDGTDQHALLITAKGLATRGDPARYGSDPYELVGDQMVQRQPGVYYSKYPIGYPLLCAAAYRAGGPTAPFLVNPILGALAIVGLFCLGRALRGPTAGVCAATVLAVDPVYTMYGPSALSHTAAVCFAVWGLFFVWRWTENGGLVNAAVAGGLTTYTATIRYAEALLLLPVLAMVLWRTLQRRHDASAVGPLARHALELVVMAGAAVIALLPLLWYQQLAFGSPFVTGYAASGESTAFGWGWFAAHIGSLLGQMFRAGAGPVFVLGLVGLSVLARHQPQQAVFLGLWTVPLLVLYCAYYHQSPGHYLENLRYYLTLWPGLILSALAVFRWVPAPRWRAAALAAFMALTVPPGLVRSIAFLNMHREILSASKRLSDAVGTHLPHDAVLVSSERALEFLDYTGDYRLYDQSVFTPSFQQWAQHLLAGTAPTPFQRQRVAALLAGALAGKDAAELETLQADLIAQHLSAGREVAVLSGDRSERSNAAFAERFRIAPIAGWPEVPRISRDAGGSVIRAFLLAPAASSAGTEAPSRREERVRE